LRCDSGWPEQVDRAAQPLQPVDSWKIDNVDFDGRSFVT
jgi:hypothetical protein